MDILCPVKHSRSLDVSNQNKWKRQVKTWLDHTKISVGVLKISFENVHSVFFVYIFTMSSSTALFLGVSNISSYFNLALFICTLFTDGRFQYVHILYDGRLAIEISSICPNEISWHQTDISEPILSPHGLYQSFDST